MNDNFEKILASLRNIRLSKAEKDSARRNILNFIENNSARSGSIQTDVRLINQAGKISSIKFRWSELRIKKVFSMPALIVAIVLVISGGTAFAAESSLPGDALYPVKTNINEKIVSAVQISDEAKAEWRLKLTERRLEETEKLTVEGRLDAEKITLIESHFQEHEQRLRDLIEKMEARGEHDVAARLSSNLEATLAAHAKILEQLRSKLAAGTEENDDAELVGDFLGTVKIKLETTTEVRVENEGDIDGSRLHAAAENRMAAAGNFIQEVQRFIAQKEDQHGAEAVARAKQQLTIAEATLAEASAAFEAEDFAKAFRLSQKAHRQASEAKQQVRARAEFEIEFELDDEEDEDGEIQRRMQEKRDEVREKIDGVQNRVNESIRVKGEGTDVRIKIETESSLEEQVELEL